MEKEDENKESLIKRILLYLYNIFKEYKIISLIIGILLGYTFSRPREYLLGEIIITMEYQMRKKNDSLIELTQKIQQEIEVNRQITNENESLEKENEELKKKLNFHKQIEISLKKLLKDIEIDLNNSREKILSLENQIEKKQISMDELNLEKKRILKENKKLELNLIELQNSLKDSNFEILNLNNLLKQSKENQKIFQYVLGKFSPELASKLSDIQLIDFKNEIIEENEVKKIKN
eukprot:gene12400-6067_t